MNYKIFKDNPRFFDESLRVLEIVNYKTKIIKIKMETDFDISEYKREITSDYYFTGNWEFDNEIKSISQIDFIWHRLYHFDDLEILSNETGIENDPEDSTQFLNTIYELNSDNLNSVGIDPNFDLDDFKLRELRLKDIDNERKIVNYEGSYLGDSFYMDPLDWGIYSLVRIKYLQNKNNLEFYKDLIFESYNYYNNGKYLLGYFMAFLALECFVNAEFDVFPEKQDIRLSDKINKIFKKLFTTIDKHPIYTQIISFLDNFTKTRNEIAHGKSRPLIDRQICEDAQKFVFTLILSYKTKSLNFEDLNNILNTPL